MVKLLISATFIKEKQVEEVLKMTDSMKFGPEWLRNMSAEPSVVSNNVSATVGSSHSLHAVGTPGPVGAGSNNLTSHTPSRNLFPEYRYGREEMLSLFDRNCLLPQILPSFKKLFVDKVQYPLALTPSSEEEINSHSPLGSGVSTWTYIIHIYHCMYIIYIQRYALLGCSVRQGALALPHVARDEEAALWIEAGCVANQAIIRYTRDQMLYTMKAA